MSRALKEFPDKTYSITADLLALCLEIEDYDKLFEVWDYGLTRGYFYHLHARGARAKILKARQEDTGTGKKCARRSWRVPVGSNPTRAKPGWQPVT